MNTTISPGDLAQIYEAIGARSPQPLNEHTQGRPRSWLWSPEQFRARLGISHRTARNQISRSTPTSSCIIPWLRVAARVAPLLDLDACWPMNLYQRLGDLAYGPLPRILKLHGSVRTLAEMVYPGDPPRALNRLAHGLSISESAMRSFAAGSDQPSAPQQMIFALLAQIARKLAMWDRHANLLIHRTPCGADGPLAGPSGHKVIASVLEAKIASLHRF